MSESAAAAVLLDLEAATDRHPLDRKLLVSATLGEGRELLRALARRRSWVGWEVTTLRRVALELVAPALPEGVSITDVYAEQAAVDTALDDALADSRFAALRELGDAPGFRQAVANAVVALRLAGVATGLLRHGATSNPALRDLLSTVLDGYSASLASSRRIDAAEAMARAGRALERRERGRLEPDLTYLVPGLSLRGAGGRLVRALVDAGATPLRSDPVSLEPPSLLWNPAREPGPLSELLDGRMDRGGVELELYAASGPGEEIREVLRRVMAGGLRWDEVEIIATDPVVYGGALHALAERLEIPVTFAVGLPVERTRAGRAVAAYFRWIQAGYPADVVRRLLESEDLRPAGDAPSGRRLARRLRALRIGRGSDRYLPAIERALDRLETEPRPRRRENEAEAADRVERERRELEGLRRVLRPVLEGSPRLDRRSGTGEGRELEISPARLARGLVAFLERVAPGDGPSATARERLLAVAERVAATLDRPTRPAAAIALLRQHLEIRVPAPQREGSAPWVSTSGHLHLSDVEHGGRTGRRATFVVGLDADRFPGAGLQDPLLPDAQRRALDPAGLPTSADRIATARFRLAACLARLRGTVTLSYSAWDPAEARAVAPASVLLQAYRARAGHPSASFEDLRNALGRAASAIPTGSFVDATDLWLGVLEHDGLLRNGEAAVRGAYPGLDAGLRADAALAGPEATPHHGLVRPRPDRLDPRRNTELVLSASGLEDLGSCALRYFYRYGLGVRQPDDPELDPDAWLNALDRGRLLHAVYEASLGLARENGVPLDSPALEPLALEVLERQARLMEREVPIPGDAIRAREMAALRSDVRSFAGMVAERGDVWQALELTFGIRGEPPATLELPGGVIQLRGAIDRVDRTDGGLTVVDYKTGGTGRFERRHGTFHGGRRLQNVVYAATAEALLDGTVERMEYHFPTRKGQNEVIAYSRTELVRGLRLIDRLLEGVAAGRFLPTEQPDDCRFCDYAPICRHRFDGWQRETPRADWAGEHFDRLPEYRERRDARAWDDTFLPELEHDAEAD